MIKHLIAYPGICISLAQMQEAYIPLFAPWANRRVGIEGTLQRPPYSIASGIEWVRSLDTSKGKDEVFAVLAHETRKGKRAYRYIGHTGLHHITGQGGFAITGSVLGADGARGKGYGTEVKLRLLYHAFYVLGLREVRSSVKAFNGASLGHLIKCGYVIRGRWNKSVFHEGAYVDEILLQVTREEFDPIWRQYQESHELPKLTDAQRMRVKKETAK